MSPELRAFVIEMANNAADLQLQLIEENYLTHEAFDPRPSDKPSLEAAWESFLEQVDEPWWHLLEEVSDKISEEELPEVKTLLVETFKERILDRIRAHLNLG